MFGCFKDSPNRNGEQIIPRLTSPQNSEKAPPNANKQKIKDFRIEKNSLFEKKFVIVNEELDCRDEKIIVPFNVQKIQKLNSIDNSILDEITQWLVYVNFITCSRGFHHFVKQHLTENQSKNYTAKNILLNLKHLFQSLKSISFDNKKILMEKVNQIQSDILQQTILKYPQTTSIGASKRIRNMLHKIDNRSNDEYDFLLKNDISFVYHADQDYTADVMKALNKMISFASESFGGDLNEIYQTNYEIFHELIEFIISNDVSKKEKMFFEKAQHIYNYKSSKDVYSFDFQQSKSSKNQDDQYKDQSEKSTLALQSQNPRNPITNFLKISHKIPLETKLFSDEEIGSGQFKIRNSAILRIIAKWTFQLADKLSNPKELILKRVEKFKLRNKKLISLENNQKLVLYQIALKEKQKIEEYLQLLRNQNIMLQTLFSEQTNVGSYSTEDINVQIFASRVRDIYSQCMFKYLCRLIHSLKKIAKEASQLYLERFQDQMPQEELKTNYETLRDLDLVSFKVGDLLRAKFACPESQVIKIYRNLTELSEKKPEILKIVRIKNRLDQKQNDILINFFFTGKIQCQLQLSINQGEENQSKAKYYSTYNHFLYQLMRSLFGPIGQFSCILGQHDPVVNQYVRMDDFGPHASDIHRFGGQLKKKKDQQSVKLRQIKELSFVCSSCGKLRRFTNSQLYKNKSKSQQNQEEDLDEDEANAMQKIKFKECNKCYLQKLQKLPQKQIIKKLIGTIYTQSSKEYKVFTNHLKLWSETKIPLRYRQEQIFKYLPKEGLILIKDSKMISLEYFRTFIDEDYIYFSSKIDGNIVNQITINKIFKQKDLITELSQITKKMFIFSFDENLIIQNGGVMPYLYSQEPEMETSKLRRSQIEVAICRKKCCDCWVELGSSLEWKQFNQSINRKTIKKILDENKNVMYLSKSFLGRELNEIILYDKKYERSCKGINIIEAEDSRLKNIEFVSKMENLSDLYIRYNSNLTSLQGVQNCHNLKILFCNECAISSIKEISSLTLLEQLYVNQNKLTTLQGLEKCSNLVYLACYWNLLENIRPISDCKNLQKLDIGYNKISDLKPLALLTKLKILAISKNEKLTQIEDLRNLIQLETIDISHTPIKNIKAISKCMKLEKINCSNTKIQTLTEIIAPELIELDIGQCELLSEFDLSKRSCLKLQNLIADNCPNMSVLTNLQLCGNLKGFLFQKNNRLKPQEFYRIGKCRKLQQLNLSHNNSLNSLYFLQFLPQLINFSCQNCPQLKYDQFLNLKKCVKIQMLNLNQNKNITSLQFLKNCVNLQYLFLNQTNINPKEKADRSQIKLVHLKHLQLKNIPSLQVESFQFLKESASIEKIVLDNINDVKSLRGLEKLNNIKELFIGKLLKYSQQSPQEKQKRFLPQIEKLPIKTQRAIRFQFQQI